MAEAPSLVGYHHVVNVDKILADTASMRLDPRAVRENRKVRFDSELAQTVDSLGTIEAGKLADLILLDAKPLADIGNTRRIRAVVANGRLYRRADLERLLAEV